jgi:putative FmdB family regulatory protein
LPTYDLKCQDCDERFERFLMRIIREEDRVCPRCGSERVTAGPGGGVISIGRSGTGATSGCGPGAFT